MIEPNSPPPWYCRLDGEDGVSALKVSGSDRVSFLNGQLTNDITLLNPDSAMLAGWCNNKGRLVTICQLVDWQEAIWLLMPTSIIENVKKKLGMYVLRADVQLEIAEATLVGLGDGADVDTAELNGNVYANENGFIVKVVGDPTRSIYLIPDLVDVDNEEIDEVEPGYFWLRGIQLGLPRLHPETQEKFVAQQVNLDLLNGISFNKGCYIGQEIIARTQNLGRIKRRMYSYTCEHNELAEPGSTVLADGKPAGQIVDTVSDGNQMYFTAVISIDKHLETLQLEADTHATVHIEHSNLPYAIPE